LVAWFFGDQLLVRNFGLYGTICRGNAVNPLKPNGNYMYLMISNSAFCMYELCMILSVNGDYFFEQR
jgi:hypothetical protein